ncbi:aldehyde dehydrogenase (NAD+) [Granulicella rosea]|uniref:Aldehyde dehydrogenase (NAD+) n=1 Tax=Granulicella rosea TaxID=474952 RepID=A0A239JP47_9BACT|nr:aldehyde dehydrogenase family protein [Granulicella rosea]SNT06554.1 aldehyde dehydrogenase (NAD+) [Granulicella rosea]
MNSATITTDCTEVDLNAHARLAQRSWAALPVSHRLRVLKIARGLFARNTANLVEAIPATLARTQADTLAAEVLPLLAGCRFLESNAARLLKPKRLGRAGLPFWLAGVSSEVYRAPFGVVLIIGPANYPLFLPGVQALQALAAGNAVVWKPGRGGRAVAEVFAATLEHAGLPEGLLRVTDEAVEASLQELAASPDKIVFTGSAQAARSVLAAAAETLTPCIVEASGSDAVIALPTADPARLAQALAFGMRLNGSETCMAPRRLLLVGSPERSQHEPLLAAIRTEFAKIEGIPYTDPAKRQLLRDLLADAKLHGAEVWQGEAQRDADAIFLRPILILNGTPAMRVARTDIFAPILTVIPCPDEQAVLEAQQACPFGLTAAIFGEEAAALRLSERLTAGTILINDLIVPTADPRIPFGGRRASGYGVTRGPEGLLEMTAAKSVLTRRGKSLQHYAPTTKTHAGMFEGVIQMSHAPTRAERWAGLRRMIDAARKLR